MATSSNVPQDDPSEYLSTKRIRLRLCNRHGFKEDELDSLFKTEADLRAAYSAALKMSSKDANSQQDMSDKDDYTLSQAESSRLRIDEMSRLSDAAQKLGDKHVAAQASFPEHARVDEKTAQETARNLAEFTLGDLEDEEDVD